MHSNLAYLSGVSSISSSTLTSLGSAESMLVGTTGEPMYCSSPFFLNNIHYGPRSGEPAACSRFHLFLFICEVKLNCVFVCLFRLEMLQQIANRVQRDCLNGEDKLSLARTALQSVSVM